MIRIEQGMVSSLSDPAPPMTVADALAKLHQDGLKNHEIARRIKATERTVYRWCTGDSFPMPVFVARLSDLVGQSVDPTPPARLPWQPRPPRKPWTRRPMTKWSDHHPGFVA